MEDFITEDDCKEILKKYSPESTLLKFSIKSLKEEVEGYLSCHYSLAITYLNKDNQEESEEFFMKKLTEETSFFTQFARDLDVFRKEAFIYRFSSELEKMENFSPFAPKCYLNKKDVIVMENLTNKNYYVGEKNTIYNLEECKAALKTLALFHATFIAYEEQKSKELSRKYRFNTEFPQEFEDKMLNLDENTATYKYFATSLKVLMDLVDAIPNNINKEELKMLILEEEDPSQLQYLQKYRFCVLHCDLWNKNIMFRKTGGEIKDCRLVDFQLLRYFLPGYDINLFFNATTSAEFRKNHRNELLSYYYKYLELKLKDFGVDCSSVVPLEEFLDGIIISNPSAKIFAINDAAIMQLPETLISEVMENHDIMEEMVIHRRAELILGLYNEKEEFRQWIAEELIELYDALVLKKKLMSS